MMKKSDQMDHHHSVRWESILQLHKINSVGNLSRVKCSFTFPLYFSIWNVVWLNQMALFISAAVFTYKRHKENCSFPARVMEKLNNHSNVYLSYFSLCNLIRYCCRHFLEFLCEISQIMQCSISTIFDLRYNLIDPSVSPREFLEIHL